MKKILFTSYNLGIGGIEKALVNLLNKFDYEKYKIDLILQDEEKFYELNKNTNIIYYKISKSNNIIIRKIINRLKIIFTCILKFHKYDTSICYATYDIPSSIIARYASFNSILWVHSDYFYVYEKDLNKIRKFFNSVKVDKFKYIVFVSDEARDNFILIYPNLKNKTIVINNIVNDKEIVKLSGEDEVDFDSKNSLLYVGRLEENSKCLRRLFEVMKKIKNNKKDIHLYLVGDGPDRTMYEDIVLKYDLTNYVTFLGKKSNPYPYIKKCDAIILTSNYEGFPVIYLEALTLNKKIITTIGVSSGSLNIRDYALVVDKDVNSIYNGVIECFSNKDNKKFDIDKYNKINILKLEKLIGECDD